jgi:hypothetical protein
LLTHIAVHQQKTENLNISLLILFPEENGCRISKTFVKVTLLACLHASKKKKQLQFFHFYSYIKYEGIPPYSEKLSLENGGCNSNDRLERK